MRIIAERDTMRYRYADARKDFMGDDYTPPRGGCGANALTIITGLPYDQVVADIIEVKRENRRSCGRDWKHIGEREATAGLYPYETSGMCLKYGFRRVRLPAENGSLRLVSEIYPTCLVETADHILAIVGGVLLDRHDTRKYHANAVWVPANEPVAEDNLFYTDDGQFRLDDEFHEIISARETRRQYAKEVRIMQNLLDAFTERHIDMVYFARLKKRYRKAINRVRRVESRIVRKMKTAPKTVPA